VLVEPPGSPGHPRSHMILTIENWLLLSRPRGFASWLLHSLCFMTVPWWGFFFYVGFINDLCNHAHDTAVCVFVLLIFLIPVVRCNYVVRKVDDRVHRQPKAPEELLER
jgi:hypothetical protein